MPVQIRQVTYAWLLHIAVVLIGIFGPLALSASHIALTGTFADSLMQWDSQWFTNIARYGYVFPLHIQQTFALTGNTIPFSPPFRAAAFFPGLPIIIHTLGPIGALILTNVVYLLVLWLMYTAVKREYPALAAPSTILFAVNPCTIFFSALYTETYTVLAVLLIVTGLQRVRSPFYFGLTCLGVFIATSVHDLGAFAILFSLRFIRLRMWWRGLCFVISALIPPLLYELYLIAHFHTPFALFAAEDSWSRSWRAPFVNLVHTILSGAFSLNTCYVIVMCGMVIWVIAQSLLEDHAWRIKEGDERMIFSLESAIWMGAILLLGLCAYIPGYPLMSVLRFFCILWPAYLAPFAKYAKSTTAIPLERAMFWTGALTAYATFGAALYSHGWFFQ